LVESGQEEDGGDMGGESTNFLKKGGEEKSNMVDIKYFLFS